MKGMKRQPVSTRVGMVICKFKKDFYPKYKKNSYKLVRKRKHKRKMCKRHEQEVHKRQYPTGG